MIKELFMEQPITFTFEGSQLFGIMHIPERARPLPVVVMYHGLTGHHLESHLLFVKISRALAKVGIASFRFDFRGSGNSEGDFQDMTISREIDDALAGLDFISVQSWVDDNRIGVLGLSLGGGIAAVVTGRDDRVKSAVLLSAVARPKEDFAHIPPIEPTEDELPAQYIGAEFQKDLDNFRPLDEIVKRKSSIMIIHGTDDEIIPCSRAEDYQNVLLSAHIPHKVMIIPQANHTYSQKIHEDQVVQASVNWLLETL